MKLAIDGLNNAWDVYVKYNATDYINGGLDQARTWFISFNVPVDNSIKFVVDQSSSSGCTPFQPSMETLTSRLQIVKYVLGSYNDWNVNGVPTVVVENTQSTSTTHVVTELGASTVHSFVVAPINSVGVGLYGPRSLNVTTSSPSKPNQVSPAPVATNASTNGMKLSWVAPSGNGLAITGYRIDVSYSRSEIQTIWLNVDTNPTTSGTNGGSFRIQLETLNTELPRYTSCLPWDVTASTMLVSFSENTWNHNNDPYNIINVTRGTNHYSAGNGYIWSITFSNTVGNVPSLNVTKCQPIDAGFSQTGGKLSARTSVDGYLEKTETLIKNTFSTDTSLYLSNLLDSSYYRFKISAIHAVGDGPLSLYGNTLSTLKLINCMMQEWNPWNICETIYENKKQCGEYICRFTSCGKRVCGRRACNSIDVSKINFNIHPNATQNYQEMDTESFQNRTRYVLQVPINGGVQCPSNLVERRPCCNNAKINKAIELNNVKLVCNGTHFVGQSFVPVKEVGSEETGLRVDGNGEIVSSSSTCRL